MSRISARTFIPRPAVSTQTQGRHSSVTLRRRPELNFEVQHMLGLMEAFVGCFVCMSFSGSLVEMLGDRVALVLG